jgi:hypothetical protein
MTPEEIRSTHTATSELWQREICAQIAEMNGNLQTVMAELAELSRVLRCDVIRTFKIEP